MFIRTYFTVSMSLVWISKAVISHIVEEAMSLLVFYYCIYAFFCVVCCHFCCPMSLFQAYITCQNFTLTWPHKTFPWNCKHWQLIEKQLLLQEIYKEPSLTEYHNEQGWSLSNLPVLKKRQIPHAPVTIQKFSCAKNRLFKWKYPTKRNWSV